MKYEYLYEPSLMFGRDSHCCPRKGITLYDVYDINTPSRKTQVNIGVVGTAQNNELIEGWLELCKNFIPAKLENSKPNLFVPFCGFNEGSGYKSKIHIDSSSYRGIPNTDIKNILKIEDHNTMVQTAVDLFYDHIEFLVKNRNVDVIICGIPKLFDKKIVGVEKPLELEESLETEESDASEFNFRRAIKARVMDLNVPIQLIREHSLTSSKSLQDDATKAWDFCTAIYYKANNTIPWRMPKDPIRPSTCYVGISFYVSRDKKTLQTSLAQMFDEYGNGIILRGMPVELKEDLQPHMTEIQAATLLSEALEKYHFVMGSYPAKLVLHKTSRFNNAEFSGFEECAKQKHIGQLDFVTIFDSQFRFFRNELYPPQRGSLFHFNEETLVMMTRGSIPYYQTYPGMYVPTPIEIRLSRFDDSPTNICRDILALSKMNWNNTQFDGKYPITIACARKVGEIMKYIPEDKKPNSRYAFYM